MFAETISQPSSCFADVKLVTGGAPYAIDDIAGSAVEMIARAFECARFKFCG